VALLSIDRWLGYRLQTAASPTEVRWSPEDSGSSPRVVAQQHVYIIHVFELYGGPGHDQRLTHALDMLSAVTHKRRERSAARLSPRYPPQHRNMESDRVQTYNE
jgi:hypothetical protein